MVYIRKRQLCRTDCYLSAAAPSCWTRIKRAGRMQAGNKNDMRENVKPPEQLYICMKKSSGVFCFAVEAKNNHFDKIDMNFDIFDMIQQFKDGKIESERNKSLIK